MNNMKHKYDAIIIGAGIGGLTCGNLLARKGLDVLILEQHSLVGGYCTSYKRGDYLFDVPCVIGSVRKGDPVEQILSYIGVTKKVDFLELDKLARIVGPDMEIDWHSDTYKLEHEFLSKFPNDRKSIRNFFSEIRIIWEEISEAHYKPGLLQMLLYPFQFPRLVKYGNCTLSEFLDRFFSNEKIKEFLGKESVTLGLCKEEVSALLYIGYIMGYSAGGIWYPKGGFQNISNAFADCLKECGGTIITNAMVNEILIENKSAVGVRLSDGKEIFARIVISNADTKNTYLKLIDPKKIPPELRSKVEKFEQSTSGFVVKLAVKMEIPQLKNYAWLFYCPEYGSVRKMLHLSRENKIDLENCSFSIDTASLIDTETAPAGISIINLTIIPVPFHYSEKWMSSNKQEYKQLKEKIAAGLIRRAEKFLPGLSEKIVAMDISTPITYERYTLASGGGWYDIAMTPGQSLMNRVGPDTPIKNLFSTGAKSMPGGGLNAAIPAGLYTADLILKGSLTNGRCYLRPELLK
ncbi:MAG: NAD(P)/FAD-dependent oxidoreductase [Candidatus Riflebacteria bacterium]|nr:NAD(P)/FAD-dependent oxidoreductase [Candidatus Riflebacteria bacterium]